MKSFMGRAWGFDGSNGHSMQIIPEPRAAGGKKI